MKYLMRMKKEGGFSLVELMVSVGIIGTMTTIAVPKYQQFRANAAQSEAQATLSSIYTLQQLKFVEDNGYAVDLTSLGFDIPSGARYTYDTDAYINTGGGSALAAGAADRTTFKATADSGTPLASCAGGNKDMWCVNHDKELKNNASADYLPCKKVSDNSEGGC